MMDRRTRAAQECHDSAMESYREIAKAAEGLGVSVRQLLARPDWLFTMFNMSRRRRFHYMGRSLTEELLQFILKERPGPGVERLCQSLPSDWSPILNLPQQETDVYGFSFITGPPGAGKTFGLLAAFFYLHAQFFTEEEASSSKRQRRTSDTLEPRPSKRVVFLNGVALRASPAAAIWNSLFMGFLDDKDALKALEEQRSTAVTFTEIDEFLMQWSARDQVIFLVDDGNKVDRDSEAAYILVRLLDHCKVVFCASVSSTWIGVIRHSKTRDYKIVGAALDRWFKVAAPVSKTGRVPGLLQEYAVDKEEFARTIKSLERELETFFTNLEPSRRQEVYEELAGTSDLAVVPYLLETKCFFKGADGRLRCLSSDLHSYALSKVFKLSQEAGLAQRLRELDFWTEVVRRDNDIVRIGWNTEMATLLAVSLLELTVPSEDEVFTMRTRGVNHFSEASKLIGALSLEPTCHAPLKFNHTGLGFYYEDERMLVAVQVSVGLNSEKNRKRTVEKAEEIFKGDTRLFGGKPRTKVLLWIIYTSGFSSRFVQMAPSGCYYYVTMPFERFSNRLKVIDDTVKKRKKVCNKCMQAEGAIAWVQCDSCDLWYHQKCENFSDNGRPSQPFECGDCRDFI